MSHRGGQGGKGRTGVNCVGGERKRKKERLFVFPAKNVNPLRCKCCEAETDPMGGGEREKVSIAAFPHTEPSRGARGRALAFRTRTYGRNFSSARNKAR